MVRREESFLWMADRRRELILSGGFNVYPSQVEAVLRQVPGVADIAVIGADNGSASETVVAAVVLDTDDSGEPTAEGRALSLEVLRSHGERLLPHYALPRRLEIIDEMPRSMIGKVLRREVRELLERRQHQA